MSRETAGRQQTENALRALQAQYKTLQLALDAASMGIWHWDIKSGKVSWSPGLEKIHGFEPGTFPGTFEAYQKDIHPDDREQVLSAIRQTLEQGKDHRLEYRLVWPDGSIHWIEARGKLSRDENGEPVSMIGVCGDIDARKHIEQTSRFLAEASATLANLVDYESTLQQVAWLAVPDFADWCAVDLVDEEGRLKRLAVAHADPLKAQFAYDLHRRYPTHTNPASPIARALAQGRSERMEDIPSALLEQLAQDEEHLAILRSLDVKSYIVAPLKTKQTTIGVLTFAHAESGRRYSSADQSLAEDLAHRAAIAIENARFYREIQDANRRKDEFLAMLAHELRNPLAPISTGLDVLKLQFGERDIIALMQRQIEYLVRLVDDLLDVSRIMRGKIELKRQPTKLSEIMQRALETVHSFFDQQRHELTVEKAQTEVWLDADPVRLSQVLGNLLHNAGKYTEPGGHIRLSAAADGDTVSIRVSDNGLGIETELLPHVFDLFTQSQRAIDRSQGGLGIGLTVARTLVEMHGGTISVCSEGKSKGSEFTVSLPMMRNAGASTVQQQKAAQIHTAGRRVLVVDDNVDATKTLLLLLQQLGNYEVSVAHNGPDALAAAIAFAPDLILLDIGLPRLDGYEVARRLRENPKFENTLLVAMTGYGQEQDRRYAREAGFDEHLVKPLSLEMLKAVLARPELRRQSI